MHSKAIQKDCQMSALSTSSSKKYPLFYSSPYAQQYHGEGINLLPFINFFYRLFFNHYELWQRLKSHTNG